MHHDACIRVLGDLIDAKLLTEVQKQKALTAGARDAGAKVHVLPERPKDIEDDGEFHFAVLGPKAVSSSGSPSAEAKRFLDETTAADRPRVYRNAVVLAVPSREGLEVARIRIRDYLAWEEVQHQLKDQELDPLRAGMLVASIEAAKKKVSEAVLLMYGVVVTVSDKNEAQAFKVTVDPAEPLFGQIVRDKEKRARIQETPVEAEALLPDGPFNLWRTGETSRRVKDLVGAFAQFPHLPKMLRRKEILDTLMQGAREGFFVLRCMAPDRTARTFWRQEPGEDALRDPSLEVVLLEAAEVASLPPSLLVLQALPGLWAGDELSVGALLSYFAGGHVVQVPRQGYEEPVVIPKSERAVVEKAIEQGVQAGQLWLVAGQASLWSESVPPGVISDDARLRPPPAAIPVAAVLPDQLTDAWRDGATTAADVASGLSVKAGRTLPWPCVRAAIDSALRARVLERAVDSGPWPCEFAGASAVRLCLPGKTPAVQPPVVVPPAIQKRPGVVVAEADLKPAQVQDLAEQVGELAKVAVGYEIKMRFRMEVGGAKSPPADLVERLNKILAEVAKELELQ
jgi:hypothetical protein